MDHEPDVVRVESRFERPGRAPSFVVATIAAFLLIAILKPWSFGDEAGGGPRVPSSASASVGLAIDAVPSRRTTPTPAPTPPGIDDPNAMTCMPDDTEQIVIMERSAGREVRSWIASRDVAASGPLDPRLVPTVVFSSHVVGLGVCAPRTAAAAGQPAARLLEIQSIDVTGVGARATELRLPAPITLQPSDVDAAVLYGVPGSRANAPAAPQPSERLLDQPVGEATSSRQPSSAGEPSPAAAETAWPTGAYAIAFRFASDDPNLVRWLRVDLVKGAG